MKLLYFLAIIAVLYGTWAQVLPEEPVSSIICSQYSDFKALSSKFWSPFDCINNPRSTAPILETHVTSSPDATLTSSTATGNESSATQSFVPNTPTDSPMMSPSPDFSTSTLPDSSSSATPIPSSTATLDQFPLASPMKEPCCPGPRSDIPSSTPKTPTWPMNTETNATPIPTGTASSAELPSAKSACNSDHESFVSAMWPLSNSESHTVPEDDGSGCKKAWPTYLIDVDGTMTTTTTSCWPMKNFAAREFWRRCLLA